MLFGHSVCSYLKAIQVFSRLTYREPHANTTAVFILKQIITITFSHFLNSTTCILHCTCFKSVFCIKYSRMKPRRNILFCNTNDN